jgi:hypothetical protein
MINAAIILPTIAPTAVLSRFDKPDVDVGPARVELEVADDSVDEPDTDVGISVIEEDSVDELIEEDSVDELIEEDSVDELIGNDPEEVTDREEV